MAFLRADVDRFCREVADLAPAVRLRRLAELRAMLDEVTNVLPRRRPRCLAAFEMASAS
ncbi:hypothetical protein [Nonomuraea sp. NPDC049607]|uniref:hypothetical protein n=1 Tax=Nonomuraea sp. NPDC049607 TaxID=3154732 RepID=UPI003433ACEF